MTDAGRASRADTEFFDMPAALGIGFALTIALLVVWVVQRVRLRADAVLSWSGLLSASMVSAIVVWALVMFLPDSAVVHQGSLAWVFALLVIPLAWLARWSVAAIAVVGGLQLAWSLWLYSTTSVGEGAGLRPDMIVVVAVGVVALLSAVDAASRRDRVGDVREGRARKGESVIEGEAATG